MTNDTILIIDDEAPIRKLLDITLQSNGYKVVQAATAKEGKLSAAMNQPDLVMLDLGLPDDDGQNVLKILRGWFTKPIIILSLVMMAIFKKLLVFSVWVKGGQRELREQGVWF